MVLPTFAIQIGQELNDSILNKVLLCTSLVVCYWLNYLSYFNCVAGCPVYVLHINHSHALLISKAVPTKAMSISSESPVTPRSKYTEKATIVNNCLEIV